ncbi:MAG: hypothetical protein Q7S96_03255 [bacterium]|nr:hypothetical protein [bacterium]
MYDATMTMMRNWWGRARVLALRAWSSARSSPRTIAAFVFYAAFMIVVTPPAVAWYVRIAFYALALFAFSVVWGRAYGSSEHTHIPTVMERRCFRALLVLAGATLLVSRVLPFLRYGGTPLGYDTGFYLTSIDGSIRGIIAGAGLRTVRALIWLPLDWLGISPVIYFHGLYVLAQFLVAGALYAFVRTFSVLPRLAYGATIAFLFAVSIPQFFAYWWMYYQTEFAIAFLLATLTLLNRRSWLALLVGGFGAALHPATSLPLTIALALFLVIQLLRSLIRLRPLDPDTRFFLLATVIVLLMAWPLTEQIVEFSRIYLEATFAKYGWFLADYPAHLQPLYSGLYVTLPVVHLANMYLLPFVGLSLTLFVFRELPSNDPLLRRRFLFLVTYGVALLALNIAGVIYANRYLIYLDLVLIAIAVPALVRFSRRLYHDRMGAVVVVLLCAGLLLHGGRIIWKQEPHITRTELAEIAELAQWGEPDAYIMTTISHYTPWLLAFSGRSTIDPGYGTTNRWSYEQWQEFWSGRSNARRHELLRYYSRPVFMFVGVHALEEQLPYISFIQTDAHFMQVSLHVWRYDPRTVTAQDIATMRAGEAANAR